MKFQTNSLNVIALAAWLLASPSPIIAQIGMPWPGPGGKAGKLNCTGGSQTTSGSNTILTFNSSSTLVCTGSGTLTYLVIGGGGGGGFCVVCERKWGGGGGGGGFFRKKRK